MKNFNTYISEKLKITKHMINNQRNGYEYVDLDLPSGTLWAKYNVGAEDFDESGYYVRWGETEEVKNPNHSNYKFTCQNGFKKYNREDNIKFLEPEDDVATVVMGDNWCMPTREQFKELFNLEGEWVENYNNTNESGLLFYGKNGNELFFRTDRSLPESCRFWINECSNSTYGTAYVAYGELSGPGVDVYISEISSRTLQIPVRAVLKK
jgi:hypothetical protein